MSVRSNPGRKKQHVCLLASIIIAKVFPIVLIPCGRLSRPRNVCVDYALIPLVRTAAACDTTVPKNLVLTVLIVMAAAAVQYNGCLEK